MNASPKHKDWTVHSEVHKLRVHCGILTLVSVEKLI